MTAEHGLLLLLSATRAAHMFTLFSHQGALAIAVLVVLSGIPLILNLFVFVLIISSWMSVYYRGSRAVPRRLPQIACCFAATARVMTEKQQWLPALLIGNGIVAVVTVALFIATATASTTSARDSYAFAGSMLTTCTALMLCVGFATYGSLIVFKLSKHLTTDLSQRLFLIGAAFGVVFSGESVSNFSRLRLVTQVGPGRAFADDAQAAVFRSEF